jgi:hypothetical protein
MYLQRDVGGQQKMLSFAGFFQCNKSHYDYVTLLKNKEK